ncbi:MAG TPA: hypothetical protein PKD16_01320 [Saprospiraceae bacterium]|jgi:ribosomal protein L7/L12|nr:hypothetical protein [Saprospiraceae bacterium]
MNQKTFIEVMDDHFDHNRKLNAVKLIHDSKIKNGLKESKEFIDEFWYASHLSICEKCMMLLILLNEHF